MDLSGIKVSVITPTCNDEKYIRDTLKSILNQTHKNLEILIVDDCSTDDTTKIIKSFHDPRIMFFQNEKNSGAAFSRNVALSKATGDYIAFLDGDDLWALDKIEKQLNFMISNDFGFTCTEYYIINDCGEKTGKYITGPKIITHNRFLKMDYAGCLTVMYKKSIYPNLSIPDDIYKRNDYALWLKISEKEPCHYLFEKLAYYRKRALSISSGRKMHLLKYHKLMFKKLYNYGVIKRNLVSVQNIFFYILKIIFYKRRIKE